MQETCQRQAFELSHILQSKWQQYLNHILEKIGKQSRISKMHHILKNFKELCIKAKIGTTITTSLRSSSSNGNSCPIALYKVSVTNFAFFVKNLRISMLLACSVIVIWWLWKLKLFANFWVGHTAITPIKLLSSFNCLAFCLQQW